MSFSIFSFLHFFYTICLCNLFICSVQSYLLLYPQAINNYTSNRPWSKHESLTRWCVHGHLCCHVSSSSAFLSDQRTTSKTGPPWRHLGRCRCRAHIAVRKIKGYKQQHFPSSTLAPTSCSYFHQKKLCDTKTTRVISSYLQLSQFITRVKTQIKDENKQYRFQLAAPSFHFHRLKSYDPTVAVMWQEAAPTFFYSELLT